MRKIGKKYTPEQEKAMDEQFIANMHELYTNHTDVRDNPYANEYNNAEIGITMESALAHIAQSIASSMRAYANVQGGYHKAAYRNAIIDALYYIYKEMPYKRGDDYSVFINDILETAQEMFIEKMEMEMDIGSYN